MAADLSAAFVDERLNGDEGLNNALGNIQFDLMSTIYSEEHKLSKEEIFALRAFLRASSSSSESAATSNVFVAAIGGTVLCLIFLNLLWGNRLKGVRKPMLRRQGVNS